MLEYYNPVQRASVASAGPYGKGYGNWITGFNSVNCNDNAWQGIAGSSLYKRCCGWFAGSAGFCESVDQALLRNPNVTDFGITPEDVASKYEEISQNGQLQPEYADLALALGLSKTCPVGYTGTYPSCTPLPPELKCPAGYVGKQPHCVELQKSCNPGDFVCQAGSAAGVVGKILIYGGAAALGVYVIVKVVQASATTAALKGSVSRAAKAAVREFASGGKRK